MCTCCLLELFPWRNYSPWWFLFKLPHLFLKTSIINLWNFTGIVSNEHGEYASHRPSASNSPFPLVRDLRYSPRNSPRTFSGNSPRNSPKKSRNLSVSPSPAQDTSDASQLVEVRGLFCWAVRLLNFSPYTKHFSVKKVDDRIPAVSKSIIGI